MYVMLILDIEEYLNSQCIFYACVIYRCLNLRLFVTLFDAKGHLEANILCMFFQSDILFNFIQKFRENNKMNHRKNIFFRILNAHVRFPRGKITKK